MKNKFLVNTLTIIVASFSTYCFPLIGSGKVHHYAMFHHTDNGRILPSKKEACFYEARPIANKVVFTSRLFRKGQQQSILTPTSNAALWN